MNRFSRETLSQLLKDQSGPCVSIYLDLKQPHWSPRNIVRYRRLLKDAEQELLLKFSKRDTFRILSPIRYFTSLHRDLKDAKTVCFFASNSISGFFPINEKITNTVVVAPSFHIKPIVSYLNPSDAWFGVIITDQFIELSRGQSRHRETIRRVNCEKYFKNNETKPFYELIDRWLELHRKSSQVPVLIFGERRILEKFSFADDICVFHLPFAENNENFILDSASSLLKHKTQLKLLNLNKSMICNETISDLGRIAIALKENKVETLAVRADKTRWGQIDWKTGFVKTSLNGALLDCVLDDLAERALVNHTELILCQNIDFAIDVDAVATLKKENFSVDKRILTANRDKLNRLTGSAQLTV